MKYLILLFIFCLNLSAEYKVSIFLGKEKAAKHKAQMDYPFGVGFDSKGNMYIVEYDDRVWIADDENHRICLYDPQTKQLTSIIGQDSKLNQWKLKRPHGVTIHTDGSIYVVDSGNNLI